MPTYAQLGCCCLGCVCAFVSAACVWLLHRPQRCSGQGRPRRHCREDMGPCAGCLLSRVFFRPDTVSNTRLTSCTHAQNQQRLLIWQRFCLTSLSSTSPHSSHPDVGAHLGMHRAARQGCQGCGRAPLKQRWLNSGSTQWLVHTMHCAASTAQYTDVLSLGIQGSAGSVHLSWLLFYSRVESILRLRSLSVRLIISHCAVINDPPSR